VRHEIIVGAQNAHCMNSTIGLILSMVHVVVANTQDPGPRI
jgi:hypothetical protein